MGVCIPFSGYPYIYLPSRLDPVSNLPHVDTGSKKSKKGGEMGKVLPHLIRVTMYDKCSGSRSY